MAVNERPDPLADPRQAGPGGGPARSGPGLIRPGDAGWVKPLRRQAQPSRYESQCSRRASQNARTSAWEVVFGEPTMPQGRCPEPSEYRVTFMCLHEHILVAEVCGRHVHELREAVPLMRCARCQDGRSSHTCRPQIMKVEPV